VQRCGSCTINADCCPGETCISAQGSASGVCGPCNPPPDGGAPDSGTTSGDGGGSTPDSGLGTGDGGTAIDSGPPPVCSLYGQSCATNSDCCNGVPCSFGASACATGQSGCACIYPIH
jgi:hypothetical protein